MSKPFECFFSRRREKFFELFDALWQEEREKEKMNIELEDVTVKVPKKLMDRLRSMEKVNGCSPIEELERRIRQTV